MQPTDKKLKELKTILDDAEEKIATAKRILFEQVYQEQANNLESKGTDLGSSQIVEGVFDGEKMIDPSGKKYPVPANYASKSKLLTGDQIKLTITSDGTFIFKQINLVDRRRVIGKVLVSKDNYQILAEGKKYNVLQASVTYFKAKQGDEVTVIVPKIGESDWVAIENCIGKQEAK